MMKLNLRDKLSNTILHSTFYISFLLAFYVSTLPCGYLKQVPALLVACVVEFPFK
jgi:cytochrome c biogenesis protein ResB